MNNQSTDTRVIVTGGVVREEIKKVNIFAPAHVFKEAIKKQPFEFHTSPEVKDGPYLLSEFGDEVWEYQNEDDEWYVALKHVALRNYSTFNEWANNCNLEGVPTRRFRPFIGKGKEQVEQTPTTPIVEGETVDTDRFKKEAEKLLSEIDETDIKLYPVLGSDDHSEGYINGYVVAAKKYCTTPAHFHAGVSVGRVEGAEESQLLIDKLTADNKGFQKMIDIAPVDKWLEIYQHYQEIITDSDAFIFEINKLKGDNKALREALEKITSVSAIEIIHDLAKQALNTK